MMLMVQLNNIFALIVSRGGLLFLSPGMYPKYKCSISEDDDDDAHYDDQCRMMLMIQLNNTFALIVSRGGLLFLSPVMYPKYKCSISEDEDDDDDDHDDDQCSIQSINVVSKV